MGWLVGFSIPLLLILTLVSNLSTDTGIKHYGKNLAGQGATSFYFFTVGIGAVSCLAFIPLLGFDFTASTYTVVLGIIFGIICSVVFITKTIAVAIGPWAYTTMLTTLSSIIPMLSGAIWWNETLSTFKIIGIVFIIACFVLSVGKEKDNGSEKKKASLRWLIFTLIATLFLGLTGIVQKIHQTSQFSAEISMFLIIAYATTAISTFIALLVVKKIYKTPIFKSKEQRSKNYAWHVALIIVLVGVCAAICNVINLYLVGQMDSAMFFPIFHGGSLITITLFSIVLYKEKISLKQWIGLGSGVIAIVCLCI